MTRLTALPTLSSGAASADRSGAELPPRLRPHARLGVLDVTKYFGTTSGGIKTYLLEKARFVAVRPELRQIMVVPGPADRVDTRNGSRIYALRGPRIPANPPYRFLLATRSFRRIVEHERPDVIEVGSPFLVPWLSRLANRRHEAPMVWYYHTNVPRLVGPEFGLARTRGLATAALERYVRFLGRRFPVVICASDYAAAELHGCGVERVVRVPLGVDTITFHPRRREWASETRAVHGLPDGPLAIYAGRFAAEKRLDVVLDAWAEVERRSRMRLALVGAGPDEARLRAHPYAARVTWLPYQRERDRLADLLAAADVAVAPGPSETFGLAVLESLASGTPVLSVDAGGAGELAFRSRAGERYRDGDVGHLAQAAVWLARQNLPFLGERARRYAEAEHSWDAVFAALFEVYRGVTSGSWPEPR